MDNSISTSSKTERTEYVYGSKYIKNRKKQSPQKSAGSNKPENGKCKYIRSSKNEKVLKGEGKYLKSQTSESGVPAEGKYIRIRERGRPEVASKFVVQRTLPRDWLRQLTIASIYLYIGSIYVVAYSNYNFISDALFIFMLFMTVVNTVMNRNTLSIDIPNVMMALFIAYALLSSTWVISQEGVNDRMSGMFQLAILYLTIRMNIQSMKDLRVILNAIIVGTIIMCLYTVYYYGLGYIIDQIAVGGRIGQEINQVNGMGLYCAILIVAMLYMVVYEKKWIYLVFAPLAVVILLGCGSRKGFMLAFIGVFIVLFFRSGNKKILFVLGALMVLAIMIYMVYEFAESNYFFYRISQALALIDSNEVTENSIMVRSQMISYGLELFKQSPIKGYGLMQYEHFYELVYGSRRPPHSTYIQVLVSFGSIGFVLYYGIYVYFVKNIVVCLKKNIRYAVLMASIVVVMLFNDTGANMLNHKYAYIFFALLASFVSVSKSLAAKNLQDDLEEV